MEDMTERQLLETAVQLAETNAATGQRPFGAIIVLHGRIIAEGVNTALASGDPTEHAEVQAIRAACATLSTEDLSGAVVYTSCEPCVMCQATGVVTNVERMVFAASSAEAAEMGFPASSRATGMQGQWRKAAPTYVVRGDIPPTLAREPFAAWNARRTTGSVV
ncbi:nucleoside deaminase [Microbacterium kunmingense]|uniref:nucleoside deaminase n=1 Tax=Microbacterium kunmingense TaxID=2915939 RepID=UPI0027E331B9|nr:nucleoside deaminase [Microbacterium kunmingense]